MHRRGALLSRLVFPAYATSAALVVAFGGLLYTSTQEARESARRADQTGQRLQMLRGIDASMARAESAQQAYFLHGDEAFLRERDGSLLLAAQEAHALDELVPDHHSDQARVALLRSIIAKLAERMRSSAARVSPRDDKPEMPIPGPPLAAEVYEVTAALRADLIETAGKHRAAQMRRFERIELFLAAALLVYVVLVIPGYVVFLRERRARDRAEGLRQQLAESLPGAVFQFRSYPDGRRRYELLSRRSERMRGISREIAYRDPEEVMRSVHPIDRKYLMRAIESGERSLKPLTLDYRILVDGQTRWIRTTAAPKKERDGSILWSGHWQDVTVQLEMEAELLRSREAAIAANRAKSSFLASMSHEIRTPLNGVLGMVELLALSRMDAEQRAMVQVVRESGQALLRIIDDILDISKVEAGKLELRSTPASVREVIERVHLLYAAVASSKSIALRSSVGPGLSPLHVFDAVRLQQVLSNLVGNAVKFTAKGEVTIEVEVLERRPGAETLRFRVRDSGIGLTQAQIARVFEPFEQGEGDTWVKYGGTGLGLSICQRLATLMGGRISLESEPGTGTVATVEVTLPVAAQAAAGPRHDPSSTPVPEKPSVACAGPVLVVDDHPIGRMVLIRQLESLGYRAQGAESGEEALDKWESGAYAAILTDCNMPGMSGYELVRAIRDRERERRLERVPIIACTANALGEESKRCLDAGMDGYVSKPTSLAELAESLSKWIPTTSPGDRREAPLDRPCNAAPPIDPEVFEENTAGNETLAREFLERFRLHNAQDTAALREAADASRFDDAVHFAHRIRGASGALGAMDLAAVCGELEQASRNHDAEAIFAAMRRFEAEHRRLDAFIASRLGRSSCP